MIGVASGATTVAATAPAAAGKAGHAAQARTAGADAPSRIDSRQDTRTAGPDAASTEASSDPGTARVDGTTTGEPQEDHGRFDAPDADFAALLATAPLAEPVVTSINGFIAPGIESGIADPAAATQLADRLLALLTGTWAAPAAPAASSGALTGATNSMTPTTPPAGASGAMPAGGVLPDELLQAIERAPSASGNSQAVLAELAGSVFGRSLESAANGAAGPAVIGADTAPAFEGGPLSSIAATTPAPRMATPLLATPLALPADPATGFDDGFGARIAWLAGQRIGHAEIRLNPEHVGPIEVRVQLDGNRVNAEFHSLNAEVRQSIEASLPRLRELLGQHGLQLGNADVGQRQHEHTAPGGEDASGAASSDADQPSTDVRLRSRGLLDEYA